MSAEKKEPSEKEDKDVEKKEKSDQSVSLNIKTSPRGQTYDNILQTIGGTPLLRLQKFTEKYELKAQILAKLDYFNPLASDKDRVALAMIEAAENAKEITPGKTTLIEPTSGNTGASLALVAAVKGYKLILVMPENVAYDRQKILSFYGANIILTAADTGMKGAMEKAENIAANSEENTYIFKVFENSAAVAVHEQTTAPEILEDVDGKIDIFIAGIGTGAAITGIGRALKKQNPEMHVYGVEPEESAVLAGKQPAQHQIEGMGAGFVPDILDTDLLDGVVQISSAKAIDTAREAAKLEGLPIGISSGAVLAAAKQVARDSSNKDKTIVVFLPSFAERYIATELFEGS